MKDANYQSCIFPVRNEDCTGRDTLENETIVVVCDVRCAYRNDRKSSLGSLLSAWCFAKNSTYRTICAARQRLRHQPVQRYQSNR